MEDSISFKVSKKIYFINFNQDKSCFIVGTDEGYEIYNTDPFKKIVSKKLGKMGICYVSMLFRTNILALIFKNTHSEPMNENTLILWDDNKMTKIGEIEFNEKIKTILVRKDYIIVSLLKDIYIYHLDTLNQFKHIQTHINLRGLISCTYEDKFLLAHLSKNSNKVVTIQNFIDKRHKPLQINAHKSEITYFKFSKSSNMLATCSEKGTIIRIFHTLTGDLIKELRRGSEQISIDWMEFSNNDEMILCRSKKGTIHLFNLKMKNNYLPNKKNKKLSIGGLFKKMLPKYFSSEWSFAHFYFPNKKTISIFSRDSKHIIVLDFQGMYYKIHFATNDYVTIIKEHL